jgi:cephalosporin hydroxylase
MDGPAAPGRRKRLPDASALLARATAPLMAHRERDAALQRDHAALRAELARTTARLDRAEAALDARTDAVGQAVGTFFPHRPQPPLSVMDREIVDRFHDLYYSRWRAGADTVEASWLGYRTRKCPLDLWVYQELMARSRPEIIVETGTWMGGSALFLANMMDLLGGGEVVTVDIDDSKSDLRPLHPRIRYLSGSSTDPEIVRTVTDMVGGRSCMVILDSDHSRDHVLGELRALAGLVPVGSYLIVEDTDVNGHPTYPEFGPGPMEALDDFLREDHRFEIDANMERFLMTLNPRGYLRRMS